MKNYILSTLNAPLLFKIFLRKNEGDGKEERAGKQLHIRGNSVGIEWEISLSYL
jgi:hypothetical protein